MPAERFARCFEQQELRYARDSNCAFAETCGVCTAPAVERLPGERQTSEKLLPAPLSVTEGRGSVVFPADATGQQGVKQELPVCSPMPNRPVAAPEAPATVAKLLIKVAISGPTPDLRPIRAAGAWAAQLRVSGHHCGCESGQRCQGVDWAW